MAIPPERSKGSESGEDQDAVYERLCRKGLIRRRSVPGASREFPSAERAPAGTAQALLDELRGDR